MWNASKIWFRRSGRLQQVARLARPVEKQPFCNIAETAVSANASPESNYVQVNVFIDRHCFERCLIQRYREDRLLLLGWETPCEIGPELLDQKGDAVFATTLVSNRIFDDDFIEFAAVIKLDGQRISDRTLLRIVIILRELRVFHAFHLRAQGVNALILRYAVFVIRSGQATMDHRHGDHVLNAVIAVGGVIERTLFIDDTNRRFVRADRDLLDVFDLLTRFRELAMQGHRRFHRRLRVEFSWEGDLEQDVFHHVRTVWTLELELVALEEHVVEAPCFSGQNRRIAHLARLRDQRETHGTRGRIAGCPRFARTRIRCVTIRTQRMTIHKSQGNSIDQLIAREADHLTDYRSRRQFHQ